MFCDARVSDSRANHFFRDTAFSAAPFVFSGVDAFFCGGGLSGVIVGWSMTTFGFFELGAGASAVFPAVLALLSISVFGFFEEGVAVGVFGKLADWVALFFREDELNTFENCSLWCSVPFFSKFTAKSPQSSP
jgi:hypothetical protein